MTGNIKLIWGGGYIMDEEAYPTTNSILEVLNILEANGVQSIDTARLYGSSEERLGVIDAPSRFLIDTKYPGGAAPAPSTQDTVIASASQSLRLLQTDQVNIYYIHVPDRRSSFEGVLAGISSLHKAGKFKRFGISNFLAEEIDEVVRICRQNGYILPTVYQGNFSAVARRSEIEIIPTLRKHGISFYAYSPIAGGFLSKDVETLVSGGVGRWDPNTYMGQLYNSLYNKPKMLEGLRMWNTIAKGSGMTKVELAYRWVAHNSILKPELGDGIIFGSRNAAQLNQALAAVSKGPLGEQIAAQIDEVWKIVADVAPLDNLNQ